MPPAGYAALFFTVLLLVTTAYFLMGGLPLLILKHDTPVDAGFIRGFFNVYYKAASFAASGACLSYALWGRPFLAIGAAGIVLLVVMLRAKQMPAMRAVAAQIHERDKHAVARFRRLHLSALLVNLVQVIAIVWAITQISL